MKDELSVIGDKLIENSKTLATLQVQSKIIELSKKYINELPYKFLLEMAQIFEEGIKK